MNYRITNIADEQDAARIDVYDVIGETWDGSGMSAKRFVTDMAGLKGKRLDIHINSVGGLVFDGIAIANAIRQHDAKTVAHIDGLAASIASVIALAADEVRMAGNAFMMIHDPTSGVWGTAADMRREAEALDKIRLKLADEYVIAANGVGREKFEKMMADETWLTAEECKDLGLVDAIDAETPENVSRAAAASLGAMRFRRVPAAFNQTTVARSVQASGSLPEPHPVSPAATIKAAAAVQELRMDINPDARPETGPAATSNATAEVAGAAPEARQLIPTAAAPAAPPVTAAASFAELNDLVDGQVPGRNDFIVACLNDGMTVAQATKKLQQHMLGHMNAASKKATDAARLGAAAASTAPVQTGGVAAPSAVPVAPGHGFVGGAAFEHEARQRANGPKSVEFWDKVNATAAARGVDKAAAIRIVQKAEPELLKAYNDEATARRRA